LRRFANIDQGLIIGKGGRVDAYRLILVSIFSCIPKIGPELEARQDYSRLAAIERRALRSKGNRPVPWRGPQAGFWSERL
jgi:hypothetical protein